MKELREWLESINGKSLGPPSERPGFQEERARRDEEIKRRRVNGETKVADLCYRQATDQLARKD